MAELGAIAREIIEYQLLKLRDAQLQRNLAPPEYHQAAGTLWAFERLGLISEADAAAWGERMLEEAGRFLRVVEEESAHPRPQPIPPPPPVPVANVESILEQHLHHVEHRVALEPGGSAWPVPGAAEAHAIITALAELRLLDEAAERRWRQRFERASDPTSPPEVVRVAQMRRVVSLPARQIDPQSVPAPREPLVHPRPSCTQESLLDVLALSGPAGVENQLISLERYSDGLVISYRSQQRWDPTVSEQPPFPRAVRVSDDLDTHYFPSGGRSGGSGGGGVHMTRTSAAFAPAIPPRARSLLIVIGDEGFSITLP